MPGASAIPTVCLVGADDGRNAYAMINRQWAKRLQRESAIRFVQSETLAAAPPSDCILFHDFTVDVATLDGPRGVASAVVRPWDFGPYPEAWVRRLNRDWSQLWVNSTWVRELARRGGVEADRVRVVPLGVDEHAHRPDATPRIVPTQKGFRFLFVGAPILRKGIDVLLDAYESAFTSADDVSLLIKSNPREVFYVGQTLEASIRGRAAAANTPEIVLIEEHLSDEELGGLYCAATVGVFPYRAEGFCLPILEAMACGTPCIVPRFGACLDYCDDDNAFLMPVRRFSLPVSGRFAINTLGNEAEVSEVDFCEPSAEVLAAQMRSVYEGARDAVAARGRRAAESVHARFTWSHSVAALMANVRELLHV